MSKAATCRECAAAFTAQRASAEFCSTKCRSTFHNRRARRGADLFDLFMDMRFDRAGAEAAGAWGLLCRMASAFKAQDDRDRAGRRSWDHVDVVKRRNPHLLATTVGTNVAGQRRRT